MRWIVVLFLMLPVSGCSRPVRSGVYIVEGRLFVDGHPVSNANVAFHPAVAAAAKPVCPVALTGNDGRYRLTTFVPGDGAPPGDYIVTVIRRDPMQEFDECECTDVRQHDVYKGFYADPTTSPLRATVRAAHNEILLSSTIPAVRVPEQSPP